MKCNENWLREWVNPPHNTEKISQQLTLAGLEVDGVDTLAALDQVVVGTVVELTAHPDADRLRVAQVDVGQGEVVQIVCGAANVRQGLYAPVALVGATLPGGLKIKKAKLRGVTSLGMLCSERELGLSEEADGLMELDDSHAPGTAMNALVGLPDASIDIDLTPNRGDCLSIRGVSRELAVANSLPFSEPDIPAIPATSDASIEVRIENTDACPIYCARVIEGVNPQAITPNWMKDRLVRCGIRSISPLVDVTNYVMLELGQPMHAFDRANIDGQIVVRNAQSGETMVSLDETKLTLNAETLIIADASKPLALAGIIGGKDSGCTTTTTTIVLESAHFTPAAVAGQARHYGLATDAAHRFERGIDPLLPQRAIERATALLLDIVGGSAGAITVAEHTKPERITITFAPTDVARLLGMHLVDATILTVLTGIGCAVTQQDNVWQVTPPSWRFDLKLSADLVEEVARIIGYDNIPPEPLRQSMNFVPPSPYQQRYDIVRALAAREYNEAVTYSFVSPELLATLGWDSPTWTLTNPLTPEQATMRPSLLPGLIQALRYNLKRQQKQVKLFETGVVFSANSDEVVETSMLAGVVSDAEQSFFSVKQDLMTVMKSCCRFVQTPDDPLLHGGKAATIYDGNTSVGRFGVVHPQIAQTLDLPENTLVFECALSALALEQIDRFVPPSRFPAIRRDLSVVVKQDIPADTLVLALKEACLPHVEAVEIFDYYRGEHLADDSYSLALSLMLGSHERTLTDEEVSAVIKQALTLLKERFDAILRD
jgi:phenylalanyl-tRNA synthetase beta chain